MTFVDVPGGVVRMGTDNPVHAGDGEESFSTFIDPCKISVTQVSNAHFAEFVGSTGYQTDSERYGWSYVFQGLLPAGSGPFHAVVGSEWWRVVPGASWARPEGPGSTLDGRWNHPAVHISWNDASAFCEWAQVRLPTEAEWERAVQNNAPSVFPWGDELEPGGAHLVNVFQGVFPGENSCEDGYVSTAPVDAFGPVGLGLYNPIGNVWEWTAEWFDRSRRMAPSSDERLMKGGSYLCHHSYCQRYRAAARMGQTPDSTSGNVGFRVAV